MSESPTFPIPSNVPEEILEPEIISVTSTEVIEVIEPLTSEIKEQKTAQNLVNPPMQPDKLNQQTNWYNVARKLRQQNRELMQTVGQLEHALRDSQEQLNTQGQRSQSIEKLMEQQNQELNKTQEQLGYLIHELNNAQQIAQRQQLILKNLSEELESTQEQNAQLERDCAALQQDCTEKNQQIILLEQQVRELRSRLQRQQRYTLQYKAALDKCLELPQIPLESSLTPKVTSIQPWSSEWVDLAETVNSSLSPENPPIKGENAHLIPHQLPSSETPVDVVLEDAYLEVAENLPDNDLTEFLASLEPEQPTPIEANEILSFPAKSLPPKNPLSFKIQRRAPQVYVDLPVFVRHRPSVTEIEEKPEIENPTEAENLSQD